ncbi:hypothetical protein LT42_12730 [Pseudomonas lutea]|uniref:DUF4160 domain-containing protein n=1 Tax=Pseudomonas lutea TaxID=243924 RepID=A0A9X0EBP7_9PSED|nr:hypothetical protein LT42_12730 [Pseudomonas lutea]
MRVCSHKGFVIAVFTRDKHCPPHVHVGTSRWDARFLFSFWHNGVKLWDVTLSKNEPCFRVLEELRRVINRRDNLRKARDCWWRSRSTVCLENMGWSLRSDEVVSSLLDQPQTLKIVNGTYDAYAYKTQLYLAGHIEPLEIEL